MRLDNRFRKTNRDLFLYLFRKTGYTPVLDRMKRKLISIGAAIFLAFPGRTQSLLPPLQNFSAFEYQAASKNWGLATNEHGELFVANNSGLLHFDGEVWQLYELPNKTVIRSVLYRQGKIYTGSYEEFGYWTPNDLGTLEYTSLTHLIRDHEFTSEEFWEILPYKEDIVFRSFSALYIYSQETIRVVDPPMVVSDIVEYEGRLLMAGGTTGLLELQGDTLIPLVGQDPLLGKTVSDMVVRGDGLWIGTNLNGCYIMRGNTLHAWEHPLNEALRQEQLNKMHHLTNGDLVFGTIKNGLYLLDKGGRQVTGINKVGGLQNNTVLALLQYGNQLWVAEDNGIDRIQLNNPFSFYTDHTGTLGTLYDLEFYEGRMYLGSNTGIYYLEDGNLNFVEGSQGHVWDLETVGGDLLCGHNTGTFKVSGKDLQRMSDYSGGYRMIKVPETEDTYLQGTYNGLLRYTRDEAGRWEVRPVEGLGFPIKYLCFEDEQTLWVAHTYKGLYRIELDEQYERTLTLEEPGGQSLPNTYNLRVYRIRNQIVLLSDRVWYRYDPIQGKIMPLEEFQAYNGMELLHHDDGQYWFISHAESKEVVLTDLSGENLVLDEELLIRRLAQESERIIRQNDSIYYFTLTDGFARLNLTQFRRAMAGFELPVPRLKGFRDAAGARSLNAEEFRIAHANAREIRVQVSAAGLLNPRYYYELEGPLRQGNTTDSGSLVFQNLPFGNYQLRISTMGADNTRSQPLLMEFRIRPPWYLSTVSWIVYGLLALFIIWAIRWYNRRKLRRRQVSIKREMHKEHQERLARLEKEKLAREVRRKQHELTGSTMQIARKNELILELKGLLQMNKERFDNQQRYRSFMRKLNNTINDDQDWKRFEVNFNELHEDFFESLLQRFPKLTPKDLKLCAYLKMNLSTKEIAPLMGISVRGVEIHRYRLRKKLHLDNSQNISNFLITLK